MANVLKDEKKQQIIALGRLGWSLRKIQQATRVRRETISAYLRGAGVEIWPPGRWRRESKAKSAIPVITDFGVGLSGKEPENSKGVGSASTCEPYREIIELGLSRDRNAMAIWQDLVSDYGFQGGYQSVRRFAYKLRGAQVPQAWAVILTAPGEEGVEEDVMMTEFFESRFRILQLRGGQDGQLLDVFAEELLQSGFAQITARRHIRAAEHLLYWAKRKSISPATFDEHTLDEFTHHLRRCRCKSYGSTHRRDLQKGARLFVCSLRRAELLPRPSTQETVEDPQVLVLFRDWMHKHRGTCDATLYKYGLHLRALLRTVGEDTSKFEARSLRRFVQEALHNRHASVPALSHS